MQTNSSNPRNQSAESQRNAGTAFGRQPRWGGVAILAFIFALSLVGIRLVQNRILAQENRSGVEVETARFAIAHPHDLNRLRRTDPVVVQAEARAAFSILNPDAANKFRRQDPDEVAKDNWALFSIVNAKTLEQERLKNPAARRQQDEILKSLAGD